jgi:outer membrane immunogenic protein
MANKFLLAAASAVALTGSAFAADLGAPPPPPPYIPPPPVFTWTGVYAGIQIGGAWGSGSLGNFNGFDPFTGAFINSSIGGTPSGVIGGGHVGAQVQINQWIFGVEGTVDGTSLTKTVNAAFPNFLGGSVITAHTSADVQGSIRGKLGIAWDRFMIYGTGGVAFGGFTTDFNIASSGFVTPGGVAIPPFFASNSFSRTRVGWTAGGGAQYALTPNWWVFVEYRFSDFGTIRNGAFPNLPNGVFFNGSRRLQENQVQAGLSYKFDWYTPPPVVSKY